MRVKQFYGQRYAHVSKALYDPVGFHVDVRLKALTILYIFGREVYTDQHMYYIEQYIGGNS